MFFSHPTNKRMIPIAKHFFFIDRPSDVFDFLFSFY